jgi:hypothetical protein
MKAASGKTLWQERLEGDHHASLVSANGLVYFLSDKGTMTIVRAGPKFALVSLNFYKLEFNKLSVYYIHPVPRV